MKYHSTIYISPPQQPWLPLEDSRQQGTSRKQGNDAQAAGLIVHLAAVAKLELIRRISEDVLFSPTTKMTNILVTIHFGLLIIVLYGPLATMAVILIIFLVQVSLHLLNLASGPPLNNLLWSIFTLLPGAQSQEERNVASLRREVVRLHREMSAVSAQDDFAKWARLRREHDKAKDKHDKAAANTRSFRATFDRIVGVLRFLFVQGVNFLLNSYYAKQPMFWVPQGWLPHQVEWVISCPKAPLGSISVNVWGLACGSVIGMVSEAVRAGWKLRAEQGSRSKSSGEKVRQEVPSGIKSEKKEL